MEAQGSVIDSGHYNIVSDKREDNLIKVDALGHGDAETLKDLEEMTGIPFKSWRFNDPKLYEAILDPKYLGIENAYDYPFPACTMGISEMNTDFTMQMLADIKPTSFTDLIYFSGLSHGTGVWTGNIQREKIIRGELKLYEAMPVRDIIFQHLAYKYGWDPAEAFAISESVRKGKGIKKWEPQLRAKLPTWMVDSMAQTQYLFPKAHAASYILMAMRIFQYKLNTPSAFYAAILNRYGVGKNNNKNFDFLDAYHGINNRDDLFNYHKKIDRASDNPAKIKDNQRICSIILEMKMRGIKLSPANFSSNPHKFSIDSHDINTILMPLLSIKGVGDVMAENISNAYKQHGEGLNEMSLDELKAVTHSETGKKVFTKLAIEALNLEQ